MNYDELHKKWDRVHLEIRSPTYQLRKKIILQVIRKYGKKGRDISFLDVGCGTGDYAIELCKIGFQVTAFDLSEYAIKKAKTNCVDAGVRNIEFTIDDIIKFNTNKKYDIIMLSEVLEHLEDDHQVLKKYSSFLKADGVILCSVPFDPRLWSQEDERSGHVRRYDMERVNWLIYSSQLQLVELFCYGSPFLRMMWAMRTRKNLFKKIDNYNTSKQKYPLLLKIMGKIVVFFDSFNTKGKNGVGIIFLAKKSIYK